MTWPPAIVDFKAQFNRQFVYGPGLDPVQDQDITNALNQASIVFNTGLWVNDTERQISYLYLSAYFLALVFQSAGGSSAVPTGQGVNSHGGGTIESKSVGQVSVNYAIPDFVRNSPILSQYMRNDFGQQYLVFLTPRLVGNIYLVSGGDNLPSTGFAGNIRALTITTASLPGGTTTVAYSQTLKAAGGLSPLVWSLQSGTLPTGLTFSSTGVLSGTPTVGGTYYFEIKVTDAQHTSTIQNYQVVIA